MHGVKADLSLNDGTSVVRLQINFILRLAFSHIIQNSILTNLSLSKIIDPWVIHISPNAGESPCKNRLEEGRGSPAPATHHFELKNYIQSKWANQYRISRRFLFFFKSWSLTLNSFADKRTKFANRCVTYFSYHTLWVRRIKLKMHSISFNIFGNQMSYYYSWRWKKSSHLW